MKKVVIIMFVMVMLLTGCGKKAALLDANEVVNRLVTEGTYDANMEQMSDDMIAILYNIDSNDIKSQTVYCSTDATADEIAVFEAKSTESAKRIFNVVNQRVEDQKTSFEGYAPEQVEKLKKAVIAQSGNVVVLSVSSDSDKALNIVKGK